MASGRVNVALDASWLDAPSVAFYGLGNDSQKSDRSSFLYRTTTVGLSSRIRATGPLAFGGGVESIATEAQAIANDSASGTLDPNYARAHAFVEIDSRTSPDYSRSGGLYRLEVSDYRQTNSGANSFRRVDAEVQRFVPILRENWVIALRALASTTDVASGDTVPYFLMPALGGSHFLRGYSSWRFRDRNRMLFSGEYRWTAGPLVDMALFMDAGKVAARTADMNLRGLKTSHGRGPHHPHAERHDYADRARAFARGHQRRARVQPKLLESLEIQNSEFRIQKIKGHHHDNHTSLASSPDSD